MFVQEIDFVAYSLAINPRTGMTASTYVCIPIEGVAMVPGDNDEHQACITLMLSPDGAKAIVDGIARLLSGPPPDIQLPGRN